MSDAYAVAVYRAEIAEAVESKLIAGKSAWLARWWLEQADLAFERGDVKDGQRRVEHVAMRFQELESTL
ncbi:MAG: hypothetical protein KL801_05835 [Mesorhizobium sp.]|nr:hypothetical protein [Mesorhizobium sp.]